MKSKRKYGGNTKNNRGFWWTVKYTFHKFFNSFKRQKDDFFQSFSREKFGIKLVVGAVILVFILIGTLTITSTMASNARKENTIAQLRAVNEALRKENEQLELEMSENLDQVIEDKAREDYQMVYPGEQIFVNRAG